MPKTIYLKIILSVLFLLGSSGALRAQTPPAGQGPEAQAERFKTQSQAEKEELEKKKTPAPPIEIQKEEKPPQAEGASFVLKKVNIAGATLFKAADFTPLYQPYLDKKVTFKDIDVITEGIKTKYKQRGYLTTNVYLPEQEVKDGEIEIRVLEGKMGELNIEGNKYFSNELIRKFFHFKKNEILNIYSLQRDILRLNKNPDLEVKTIISAGKEPQTTDVTLKVREKFPWHIGAAFNNQGSRLTGKYRPSLFARSSNATGRGDTIFINTQLTTLSSGESINYVVPVGTYGTTFGLDLAYFKTKLGKEYKSFDITGESSSYTPRLSWELSLREDFKAYLNTGIEIKCIKKKTGGTLTANDQLRLPFFGFDFTKTDSLGLGGETTFSPRFNFGTEDFWGASEKNHPTASRQGTGGFFFKYEQAISRVQRMPGNSYLVMRSRFQAASHTLASSEQLQLGGADSVRGYRDGDYLADMGGELNSEWIFPFYLMPKTWKLASSTTPLRNQIQPVIFADLGGGKLKKVASGEKDNKFLAGIGGGLRIYLFDKIYLRLDWAKRLGDRPASGSGPSTFYLRLQSEI